MKSAVVQIPAYNEADTLPRTARKIYEQTPPESYSVDIEAWVTRHEDESGCCDTMSAAERAVGVTPYEAPEGKLSARNAAHAHALEEGYDAIVSWDADAPPKHEGVLSALLEPLTEPNVVATNSVPLAISQGASLFTAVLDGFATVEDTVFPHINGQAHAFTTEAWSLVGPFDETIDQSSMIDVRAEEEFGFYRELTRRGDVRTPAEAVVYNNPRRMMCKIPFGERPPYCDTKGISPNYGEGK